MKKILLYFTTIVIFQSCSSNQTTLVEYYYDGNKKTEKVKCEYDVTIHDDTSGVEIETLNGDYKRFYKSGKLASHVIYKDNKIWTFIAAFDSLGNSLDSSTLNNGSGTYCEFFPNGKMKSKVNIKNSVAHGKFRAFRRNGTRITVTEYSNGQKQGKSKIFYPNGSLFISQEYYDDILIDTKKMYDFNGTVIHLTEYKSPPFSLSDSFHLKIGRFEQKGGLSSIINNWMPQFIEGNGIKDGKDFSFYSNGKINQENYYFDAIPDSITREYYENGQVKIEYYTDRDFENMKRYEVSYDINGNTIDSTSYNRRK